MGCEGERGKQTGCEGRGDEDFNRLTLPNLETPESDVSGQL